MSSFLKYQEDESLRQGNGRGPLHFSRAHIDGMPYRGPAIPFKEDEYYEYTEKVNDFGKGIYDWSIKEQSDKLDEIMDRAANGWYQILELDTRWQEKPDGSLTRITSIMYCIPQREPAKSRINSQLIPTPVP